MKQIRYAASHTGPRSHLAALLCAALLLGILLVCPARVARADDRVVGDGTPGSCTEADFDAALAEAQAGDSGTITFDCGGEATIILTSQKMLSGEVTIDGGDQITLSGGNTTRLFLVFGAVLHLKNITLSNGFSNTGDGGAINNSGVLTLQNTSIRNSNVSSNFSGGAIVNYGPLTISDSHFENNAGGNGGALYLRFEDGGAEISGSTFRNNHTTNTDSGWGGAILLWGADVTIRSSTFEQNQAQDGGALHNQFAENSIVLEDNMVFKDNSADPGSGGAIFSNGSLTATNAVLSENYAGLEGGGLYLRGGDVTITDTMINGNTAKTSSEFYDYGGGIYNSAHLSIYNTSIIGNVADYGGGINNGGTVVLTQVTISGNSATIGGGLFNDDGNATLAHVTFSDNSAQIGGGISHFVGSKTITLKNVLLDRSASGGNCNLFKPIISAGFNLSSDGSCTSFTQAGDRQNVDPLLGPLADNGGPTLTHMLLPGSPAIDTGQCVKGLETDQRGLPRFQGPACDIGAVEVQPGGGPDESAVYLPAIIK